ncbi:hypothetical protein AB3K78_14920 [Leucobacter sp. HNU]|uniref:hypothetical protein n=1 Tax=Leucobacter sp. HNU TaxID=3236805 RepID=UPI003A80E655
MSVDVLLEEQIALWLADGRPDRLVWRSERWRVVDAPARLPENAGAGWRFRARSETSGALREFEARSDGEHWFVVAALAR